jgi:hypothetical protein
MSKIGKLIQRFKSKPKDFTYEELCRIMKNLGYSEDTQGKTSGSRVGFYNAETGHMLKIHKPHPANILKEYQIELIVEDLEGRNLL